MPLSVWEHKGMVRSLELPRPTSALGHCESAASALRSQGLRPAPGLPTSVREAPGRDAHPTTAIYQRPYLSAARTGPTAPELQFPQPIASASLKRC